MAASAVGVAPDTLALSLVGMTETLYGACNLLVLWLLARGSHPVWVGVGCAALYLTRYNGIFLLPFGFCTLLSRILRAEFGGSPTACWTSFYWLRLGGFGISWSGVSHFSPTASGRSIFR